MRVLIISEAQNMDYTNFQNPKMKTALKLPSSSRESNKLAPLEIWSALRFKVVDSEFRLRTISYCFKQEIICISRPLAKVESLLIV